MRKEIIEKAFTVFVILSFFVVLFPILNEILWSIIIAYILYPLYEFLYSKTGMKRFSAILSLVIWSIVIFSLLGVLIYYLYPELTSIAIAFASLSRKLEEYSLFSTLPINVEKINAMIFDFTLNFALSIPKFALSYFFVLVFTYYFLLDGRRIYEGIKEVLPIDEIYKKMLFEELEVISRAILYGQIITASVQALISLVGFILLGYDYPLLLTVLVFLSSVIPSLGTGLVWVPASIYKILIGEVTTGVLAFLYGAFVVGLIDNIIKPHIVSKASNTHPFIVFAGLIGGVIIFGPIGIFVGPILLSFSINAISRYKEQIIKIGKR